MAELKGYELWYPEADLGPTGPAGAVIANWVRLGKTRGLRSSSVI